MTDAFATYPSLRDRDAFVSGGAGGLGAEFVAQPARQGAHVSFIDVQDDAGAALAARPWRRPAKPSVDRVAARIVRDGYRAAEVCDAMLRSAESRRREAVSYRD